MPPRSPVSRGPGRDTSQRDCAPRRIDPSDQRPLEGRTAREALSSHLRTPPRPPHFKRNTMTINRLTKTLVAGAAVAAMAIPAVAQAKQGADDPAGHVRHAVSTTVAGTPSAAAKKKADD